LATIRSNIIFSHLSQNTKPTPPQSYQDSVQAFTSTLKEIIKAIVFDKWKNRNEPRNTPSSSLYITSHFSSKSNDII